MARKATERGHQTVALPLITALGVIACGPYDIFPASARTVTVAGKKTRDHSTRLQSIHTQECRNGFILEW